ncbi:MAG: hypothetical protein RL227_550 [Pseudomonadota bacterium]|jgi:asparagine synthase (glutamine-hydrolysing)
MCGIAGLYDFSGAPAPGGLLQRMGRAMQHRGPDGDGLYLQGPVGLAHRRLSIIDLDGGAQPLANEDGSVQLVFNGEIYNFIELRERLLAAGHRFRTRSDTEVIVHAYEEWGVDCVRQFNGIFAFALWDSVRKRLFLARDPLGVKPLYTAQVGSQWLFASEIKALLEHPGLVRRVDPTSLGQLFTFRYVPSPRTLFEGIAKLPPGHTLQLDAQGVQLQRYWGGTPATRAPGAAAPRRADAVETYAALVEDAVRLQMRSDVPVGLFLSSGVDSAGLLALMQRHASAPVHTYTIGFEGGEASNETDDARALARRFGARHEEMIVTADDYARYFDRYMDDLEEPVGNESAAAFYFVSRIASRGVKVVLTGQGADEPWAGYHRHLGMRLSEIYRRLPRMLTNGLIRPAVLALPRQERLKRGVLALDEPDTLQRLAKSYAFFSPALRDALFRPGILGSDAAPAPDPALALAHLQHAARGLDPVSQMLYIDTRASLPDDLLMVNDKMSMANSIESRVPFLDHRLVEFVEALPLSYKLHLGRGKVLHKQALSRWLPREVVHRRKKGFDNPVHKWLREGLAARVESLLFSDDAAVRRYFDIGTIRRLVQQHQAGRESHMRHIYLLMSFEMWHRRFIGRS